MREEFRKGNKRVLCVAPPGAGKGTIIAHMAVAAAQAGKRVLIFMHKRELVIQQGKRIVDQFGYNRIGFYLSGAKHRELPIMIGTVQTMVNRKLNDFDLIILDECHRIKTAQHQQIYGQFAGKFAIGFTATPFRGDKKGFRDEFDAIVQFTTYGELVRLKALVPTKVIAPKIAPELDGVHIRAGEYVDAELYDAYNKERIYRGVVEKWMEYANGKKTIIFNVNNKGHSQETAEWFRKYGIDARSIDCDTPKKERERLLQEFQDNKYPVLCNIGLFTEGVSIDDTECIIFNVATKVLTKWVQAAARGSRPVWNRDYSDWEVGADGQYVKPHCLILDFGHNCDRHGYVDDYDIVPFTLDGTPKRIGEAATKTCPECDFVVYAQTRVCPECGYAFEFKNHEKRIFSDEAEWAEVDRVRSLVKKLQAMPYNRLEKMGPQFLRIAGKIRNYKPSWAAYQAYRQGFVEINPHDDPGANIPKILAFLIGREFDAGYGGVYDKLDSIFIDETAENDAPQGETRTGLLQSLSANQ